MQQDHLALGAQLDIIDFETGAAVAGAKCVPLSLVPVTALLGRWCPTQTLPENQHADFIGKAQ